MVEKIKRQHGYAGMLVGLLSDLNTAQKMYISELEAGEMTEERMDYLTVRIHELFEGCIECSSRALKDMRGAVYAEGQSVGRASNE